VNTLLLAPEIFAGDGGITRILRLYLKALCETAGAGGRVRLVALNDRGVDRGMLGRYSDPHLSGADACGGSRLRFVGAALRAGLRSDRIVCGHVGQLPVAWAASKARPGLAYHLVAHGIEVWRPFSGLELRAIRGARSVWCVSDYTRRRLLEHCPLAEGRALVLPNALDPALGAGAVTPVPAGPPVILTVSRLSVADSYKGIDHLIRAMPAVRLAVPGARLRIVGRGDALAALTELARTAGVPDAVDFEGFVSDEQLAREFAGCTLFALPSEREGFGLVYLEAMAHGRPCLGARAGGTPEVITEESGVLVGYGDVPGIAAAAAAALRRSWDPARIRERALEFSYARFRDRLAGHLKA
jgi:glycosyltransferase involved in cell wall biosynthesis